MRVHLRSQWFAPNGALLEKGEQDVPDAYAKHLPSTAKRLEVESAAEPADAPAPTFRDEDVERAGAEAEQDVEAKAEETRLANAKKIRDQLAAEAKKPGK